MSTAHPLINTNRPLKAFPGIGLKSRPQRQFLPRKRAVESLTVGKILSSVRPFPINTVLLGRCEDRLPLLMSFSDPEIGSILVGGDAGCGKTHHLQVMVDSALRTHSPKDLQIAIMAHKPDEWTYLESSPWKKKYLQVLHAWYDRQVDQMVEEFVNLAEDRKMGQRSRPAVMLILDDFNFIEGLSMEAQVGLRWLLAYGPQSNIWPIAAIKSDYGQHYRYWMEAFRSRIIGRVSYRENLEHLTLVPGSQMKTLDSSEFRVWGGADWFTYRLPLLGD